MSINYKLSPVSKPKDWLPFNIITKDFTNLHPEMMATAWLIDQQDKFGSNGTGGEDSWMCSGKAWTDASVKIRNTLRFLSAH